MIKLCDDILEAIKYCFIWVHKETNINIYFFLKIVSSNCIRPSRNDHNFLSMIRFSAMGGFVIKEKRKTRNNQLEIM